MLDSYSWCARGLSLLLIAISTITIVQAQPGATPHTPRTRTFSVELDRSLTSDAQVLAGVVVPPVIREIEADVLVEGIVSLYYFKDEKEHYFAKKGDGPIQELLLLHRVDTLPSGKLMVVKAENYKRQLSALLFDCQDFGQKALAVNFKMGRLVTLIRDYHKCKGVEPEYAIQPPKSYREFSAVAGLTLTRFTGRLDFDSPKFHASSVSFPTGLALNYFPAQRVHRWSLYNELLLGRQRTNLQYDNKTLRNDHTMNFVLLKYFLGLRFTLPKKPAFFFQLGFAETFVLKSNASYVQSRTDLGGVVVRSGELSVDKTGLSRWWGVGLSLPRINLQLRIEGQPTLANWDDFYLSTAWKSSLLASYRF